MPCRGLPVRGTSSNGGAAHLIKTGERVVIMSFALSDKPIVPKKIVCNEHNEIIS